MTIDADGHIMLPADIWDKYFEPGPLYDRRPRRVTDNFGRTRLMVDGEFIPRRFGRWRGSGAGPSRGDLRRAVSKESKAAWLPHGQLSQS